MIEPNTLNGGVLALARFLIIAERVDKLE